jgi:hypothetical protein
MMGAKITSYSDFAIKLENKQYTIYIDFSFI